jgi:hypothetical protein
MLLDQAAQVCSSVLPAVVQLCLKYGSAAACKAGSNCCLFMSDLREEHCTIIYGLDSAAAAVAPGCCAQLQHAQQHSCW